jgi:hypothetical protein
MEALGSPVLYDVNVTAAGSTDMGRLMLLARLINFDIISFLLKRS